MPDHFTQPPSQEPISADFWDDIQWGSIPEHRQAKLVPVPNRVYSIRTTGLLGGAPEEPPKMSKLAALAAARNKAKAERNAASAGAGGEEGPAVSLLGRLSTKRDAAAVLKTSPVKEPITPSETRQSPQLKENLHTMSGPPTDATPTEAKDAQQVVTPAPVSLPTADLPKAAPSGFASTMFGRSVEEAIIDLSEKMTNAHLFNFPVAPTAKATTNVKKGFSGPSPDDVVLTAQSQSKGLAKGQKAPEKSKTAGEKSLEKSVEKMAIGEETIDRTPPVKAKRKLDVVAEHEKAKTKRKENANFVVIGHVDAGKSTLMGRLLYDSGVVDERTIQKYRQESEKMGKSSFALAWVLDQTGEERARGVTIDIAMNAFETDNAKFTILDAPGHRDFIPNMIAGGALADFAVLVIDSATGEFEAGFNVRGQTKEHALLVRSMGVQRIIVAVNKLDVMEWSEDRFNEIRQQMTQFLSIAGFLPKNISFIPCSGLTGDNIVHKAADGLMPWYSGPTLVGELETAKPVAKAIEKPLRMTITDVYRGGVTNPVTISGRIEVGNLQAGDTIVAVPSGETGTIKALEVDNDGADWAVAGDNVQLHLSGIEMVHLKVGDVICHTNSPLIPLREFTAKVLAFESLTPMMVDIHRGRLNASGKIIGLLSTISKTTGEVVKRKPRHISPEAFAMVRIAVTGDAQLPLEKGSRVVLRADGNTVAAGVVE